MRDGVRLATDLYRPAHGGTATPGPFPTILERTPLLATQLIRDEPAEARDLPHRLAPGFI